MLRAMAGAYALVNMAVEIMEMSPTLLIPSATGRIPPRPEPPEAEAEPKSKHRPPGVRLVRTGPSPAEKLLQRQADRRKKERA